ncbi:hypothetical protein PHMEG_00013874 [Phytophthora megakarya]|uniref:Uncharacterized protein n=1 Tax=Phytophthora megakarya TaxID=4795 RepID=A0A225W6A3_9STRA|nr:hypothetical protein PHMEG_00013874 [Phytophthora megakarya]
MTPPWTAVWDAQELDWVRRTGMAYPAVAAPLEIWEKAVMKEPNRIQHILRSSGHAPLIIIGIALQAGIQDQPYAERSVRLKEWQSRLGNMADRVKLSVLIKSSQEWATSRREKYWHDPIMRLCSPNRASKLGSYLICAFLYLEKIAALLGTNAYPEDSIVTFLLTSKKR